jgi:hypothetical protein
MLQATPAAGLRIATLTRLACPSPQLAAIRLPADLL